VVLRDESQPDHDRQGLLKVDLELPILVLGHRHQAQVDVGSGNGVYLQLDFVLELAVVRIIQVEFPVTDEPVVASALHEADPALAGFSKFLDPAVLEGLVVSRKGRGPGAPVPAQLEGGSSAVAAVQVGTIAGLDEGGESGRVPALGLANRVVRLEERSRNGQPMVVLERTTRKSRRSGNEEGSLGAANAAVYLRRANSVCNVRDVVTNCRRGRHACR
jgi:hypothetical protein